MRRATTKSAADPVKDIRRGNVLTVTLPVPPSLNNAYATFKGRRLLSREGKAYKRDAATLASVAAMRRGFDGGNGARLSLSLALHFKSNQRRDISNCVKLLEDALSAALGFDDCAVDVLHVERKENDRENPRCEVRLEIL